MVLVTLDEALAAREDEVGATKRPSDAGSSDAAQNSAPRPVRRGRAKSLDMSAHVTVNLPKKGRKHGKRCNPKESGSPVKDGKFETLDMLMHRRALKENPNVLDALREWWEAVDVDGSGAIDRAEYIELMKAIYRVKISDDDADAADCLSSAEMDADDDFNGIRLSTSALCWSRSVCWSRSTEPWAPTAHCERRPCPPACSPKDWWLETRRRSD